MNEQDFKNSQPFLFGENFGQKAKEKLESAAALWKVVYPQMSKGNMGFQGGHSYKPHQGHGSSQPNDSGPGKHKKRSHQGAAQAEPKK